MFAPPLTLGQQASQSQCVPTDQDAAAQLRPGAGGEQPFRVLVVAHVDRLARRLDRSQYYRYAALARCPGVTLFGPGMWGYRPGMSVGEAIAVACAGRTPDLILHGLDFKESGTPLLSGLADTKIATALELQDSWTVPEEQTAFINRQQFDLGLLVVGHHRPFYEDACPRTTFLWTPHAINIRLFHDYGLPKEYDVLLYGNVARHTYPFRARLAELLGRSGLRFKQIGHPGYCPGHGAQQSPLITGADLAQEINRAWITISTASIYGCLMMKYFEIAASRSLIAGNMPAEGHEIFADDLLELAPDQSDDEILGRISDCLVDKGQLQATADVAQAHGATYRGRRVGGLGKLGCFSFYPGKNLGACGEGGCVTTADPDLARRVRMLRDWGAAERYRHELQGFNYRMDALQAAILRVKLSRLDVWNDVRQRHASLYTDRLGSTPLRLPAVADDRRHVYHVYAVRTSQRFALQRRLQERGIPCGVHYPVPVHLQPAYADLGYRRGDLPEAEAAAAEELSLPVDPLWTASEIERVCAAVDEFYRNDI